jgi:hypothetical protein
MSFLPSQSGNRGAVLAFNEIVKVLESDNRVTVRRMNLDGGFYHAEQVVYEDDSNSIELGSTSENGMSYIDARESLDLADFNGDDNGVNYFQSQRYVPVPQPTGLLEPSPLIMIIHFVVSLPYFQYVGYLNESQ